MAIEKMSFVTLSGSLSSLDEAARLCIASGNFQPVNTSELSADNKVPFVGINPHAEKLSTNTQLSSLLGIEPDKSDSSDNCGDVAGIGEKIAALSADYSAQELEGLKKLIDEDHQLIFQLDHLKGIDINIHDLLALEFIEFRFGKMPKDSYDKLNTFTSEGSYIFMPTAVERKVVFGILFMPRLKAKKAEAFFRSLGFECILPTDKINGNAAEVENMVPFVGANPYAETLNTITQFVSRVGIEPDYSDFSDIGDDAAGISEKISAMSADFTANLDKIAELKKLIDEDHQILVQLEHLKGIDINIHDLLEFEFIEFRFGKMPIDSFEKLNTIITDGSYIFMPTAVEREVAWGMLFMPRLKVKKAEAFFRSIGFERILLSDKINGTAEEAVKTLSTEIEVSERALSALEEGNREFLKNASENLLKYYSKIRYESDAYDMREYALHSGDSFQMGGWVPASEVEEFTKKFSKLQTVTVTTESASAIKSEPPTKLKNPKIFKPFETFVQLYGLPSYNELDPSPIFAITYTLIFGLMFGDVGQGAVMAIGGLLYYLFTKKPFGKIVAFLGLSSTCFGFLYGSFFGSEKIIKGLLTPLEDINFILIGSVAIGIVLISVSMVLNIINAIRQKNPGKALFSHNGVAGFVFYWAVVIGVVALFGTGKNIFSLWYALAFVAMPLLLFFFQEPLTKLLARHKKSEESDESVADFVVQSSVELFDILISFITNTISFIRIGAFALSHAGMMLVVYILHDMAGSIGSIPVLIIGNIFVIVFEGFIVGIQVMRLQFYEMFSRYYDGQGMEFTPASIKYKQDQE